MIISTAVKPAADDVLRADCDRIFMLMYKYTKKPGLDGPGFLLVRVTGLVALLDVSSATLKGCSQYETSTLVRCSCFGHGSVGTTGTNVAVGSS